MGPKPKKTGGDHDISKKQKNASFQTQKSSSRKGKKNGRRKKRTKDLKKKKKGGEGEGLNDPPEPKQKSKTIPFAKRGGKKTPHAKTGDDKIPGDAKKHRTPATLDVIGKELKKKAKLRDTKENQMQCPAKKSDLFASLKVLKKSRSTPGAGRLKRDFREMDRLQEKSKKKNPKKQKPAGRSKQGNRLALFSVPTLREVGDRFKQAEEIRKRKHRQFTTTNKTQTQRGQKDSKTKKHPKKKEKGCRWGSSSWGGGEKQKKKGKIRGVRRGRMQAELKNSDKKMVKLSGTTTWG